MTRRAIVRIGIDGRPLLGQKTGIGHYVAGLCEELDRQCPEAEFYVYVPAPSSVRLPSSRWHFRAPTKLPPRAGGYFWFKFLSKRLIANDQLDWFFATRTLLPQLGPKVKSVSLVHDLNHVIAPASMTALNRIAHQCFFERDVMSATKLMTNSAGTARRILSHCGRDDAYIVRPNPPSHFRDVSSAEIVAAREATQLSNRRYLLSVATLEPRKNIGSLADAFLSLQSEGELGGYVLALVGAQGWGTSRLARRLEGLQNVVRLGYVPDALLPGLYAGADAFVFPSLYEGFGIPVAEALACGTPVVCTDIPELREASSGRGIYVSPEPESIAKGILSALSGARPAPFVASARPNLRAIFELP